MNDETILLLGLVALVLVASKQAASTPAAPPPPQPAPGVTPNAAVAGLVVTLVNAAGQLYDDWQVSRTEVTTDTV